MGDTDIELMRKDDKYLYFRVVYKGTVQGFFKVEKCDRRIV